MINRHVLLVIVLGGLILLGGCATSGDSDPEPPQMNGEKSPRVTLKRFRNMMRQQNWKYVYLLMSERTKRIYSRSRIKTFLRRTKPGILERFRLMTWNVTDVSVNREAGTGTLTLQHPTERDYKKTYRFRLENGIWRLDWSLADLLGVPRSIEAKASGSEDNYGSR